MLGGESPRAYHPVIVHASRSRDTSDYTYNRHTVHYDRMTEIHHVQSQPSNAPGVLFARFRKSADRHVFVADRLHLYTRI